MLKRRRQEQNLMNSCCLSCCSFLKCAKGWTSSTGNQYVCTWSWIELYPKIKAAREKIEMPCPFYPFPDRYLQGHTKLKGLVSSWEARIFQPPLQLWCWRDVLWQSKETPYDFGWKESSTRKGFQGIPHPCQGKWQQLSWGTGRGFVNVCPLVCCWNAYLGELLGLLGLGPLYLPDGLWTGVKLFNFRSLQSSEFQLLWSLWSFNTFLSTPNKHQCI